MSTSGCRLGRGSITPEGETYYRAQYLSAGNRVAELNAHETFGGTTFHIDDLFVNPEHQKNGIAKHLVKTTLASLETAGLQLERFDAGTTNFRVIRLMQKLGGEIEYSTDDERKISSYEAIAYLIDKVEMPIIEASKANLPEPDPTGAHITIVGNITSFDMSDWETTQLLELPNTGATF